MRWVVLAFACLVGCAAGPTTRSRSTTDGEEDGATAPAAPAAADPFPYPTNEELLALELPDPPRLPMVPSPEDDPYAMPRYDDSD